MYRPQSGYYEDIIEQAAALWESLAQNHPFLGGNKRTAFAATFTFLRMNGYFLGAALLQIFEFIDGLYRDGCFEFARLQPWLREQARKGP